MSITDAEEENIMLARTPSDKHLPCRVFLIAFLDALLAAALNGTFEAFRLLRLLWRYFFRLCSRCSRCSSSTSTGPRDFGRWLVWSNFAGFGFPFALAGRAGDIGSRRWSQSAQLV